MNIVDHFRTTSLRDVGVSDQVMVAPSDTVQQAVLAMADAGSSCAFALEHGHLTGIFTEHDVATKVAAHPDLWEAPLAMVMTHDPHRLDADQSALEALRLMNAERFRNLPVMDGDDVFGNLSQYDLLRCASSYLRSTPADDQEAMPSHSLRFVNFLGIALRDPVTLEPDDTLADAVEAMIAHQTGLISIVGPRGTVIGEFTEHDLFTKVACRVEALDDERIGDWMTEAVAATELHTSIAAGLHLMADMGHRYLVLVTETGRPTHVATFRDITEYLEATFVT